MAEVYLTQEGYDALQARLTELSSKGREDVAKKISIARDFGDLSENAEYEAAKDEQGFIEKEIREIEEKLRHAVIIKEAELDTSRVAVGNTVTLVEKGYTDEEVYRIVGTSEVDLAKNWISNESPLGQAIIGKKKRDDVIVKTPNGKTIVFVIKDIHA